MHRADIGIGPAWFDRLLIRANNRPSCPECGPVTTEIEHPHTKAIVTVRSNCPHEEAAIAAKERIEERRRHYTAWGERFGRLRMATPNEFAGLSLAALDLRLCSGNAVLAARRFLETFDVLKRNGLSWLAAGRMVDGKGLTLVGTPGLGKTTVAYALANDLDRLHYTVIAQTETSIIKAMRANEGKDGPDVSAACRSADLLVLDEQGLNKQTEAAIGEIFAILHARHERRRPTVVTSNHDTAGWFRHYSRCLMMSGVDSADATQQVERMFSRLSERNVVVRLVGEDQRSNNPGDWLMGGTQ
jgi:DNA replication protein DnaC